MLQKMKQSRLISTLLFATTCLSCREERDPIKEAEVKAQVDEIMAKQRTNMANNMMFDSVGVANGPIRIMVSFIHTDEITGQKSIATSYQNMSAKKIDAIKFHWYGENAFGEPAEMGDVNYKGFGGGYSDTELDPTKTYTASWTVPSSDVKKNIILWPAEVAFSDGTKWKSSKNPD